MDRRARALGHGALQKRDASKRLPKKESDRAARLVWLFLFARPQLVILENTLE